MSPTFILPFSKRLSPEIRGQKTKQTKKRCVYSYWIFIIQFINEYLSWRVHGLPGTFVNKETSQNLYKGRMNTYGT